MDLQNVLYTTTPDFWGDEAPFPQFFCFSFCWTKDENHAEMTKDAFPKNSVFQSIATPPKKNGRKCKAPK